jgi:hypothetical protein
MAGLRANNAKLETIHAQLDSRDRQRLSKPKSTRASSTSVFPPVSKAYVGTRTLVPETLSNRPSTKNPIASMNLLPVPGRESHQSTTINKTKSDKSLKSLLDEINAKLGSRDRQRFSKPKSTRASSTSVFPPVSKSYVGTRSLPML